MFPAPPVIKPEVFVQIPANLWKSGSRTSILEGPSFDREGNLYVVNTSYGQVFRITPSGDVAQVAEYDGEPNGLKIHKDGRIFIADHTRGLLELDVAKGTVTTVMDRAQHEPFKGLNDLVFNSQGDLYFTDQGESDLRHPDGRVWVRTAAGRTRLVIDCVPSPNGLVITPDDRFMYLAATRANAVWRVPMRKDGSLGRVGTWIQMSGGAGPDGLALDEAGGIAVAHAGMGSVWLFDARGRPAAEIPAPRGLLTTNVAYGGADRRTLFITEADTHSVLVARVPVPGLAMYAFS
ncbi:MAG: SMP-30/gluconolactonase/LRE family protein [Burkholderiaceae bacterium]|nr:SMP-30/gluconolactonase/LRE family protein [Burkholderiaceae bacterium]